MSNVSIDCHQCQARGPACADCVMSVLLGPAAEDPVSLDSEEINALAVLAESGMVPPLRLKLVETPAVAPVRRAVG